MLPIISEIERGYRHYYRQTFRHFISVEVALQFSVKESLSKSDYREVIETAKKLTDKALLDDAYGTP